MDRTESDGPLEPEVRLLLRVLATTAIATNRAGERFLIRGRPSVLGLFAFLALHARPTIARSVAAERLWPDESRDAALANLRRHIELLRRAIADEGGDPSWIVSDRRVVGWSPDVDIAVDVDDAIAHPERLQTAGAFTLAPGAEGEWLESERHRVRDAMVDAVRAAAAKAERRGDPATASSLARAALVESPYDEELLRILLRARMASGDRSGALTIYRAFEERLAAELGVEPEDETRAIRAALDGIAEASETHLLERDAHLASLNDAYRSCALGTAIAFVRGEAGIGKSAVVRVFADRVLDEGCVVWFGQSFAPERRPYEALLTPIRASIDAIEKLGLDRELLIAAGTIVEELRPLVPGVTRFHAERDAAFLAIARIYERLADGRRAVLVLEDMHGAGASSVAMLVALTHFFATLPILVVVTYRDDETAVDHPLHEAHDALHGAAVYADIPLPRLSSSAVRTLIHSYLEDEDAGRDAMLVEASGGNPLLLSSMLRNARERGVATTLRDAVRIRLNGRSPHALAYLYCGAVMGTTFDRAIAEAACGLSSGSAIDAVDELLDARMLMIGRGARLLFEHERIRACVYDEIDDDTRVHLHARLARLGERRNRAPAEVARHFAAAGLPADAARNFVLAGRQAVRIFADDEALGWIGRALECDPSARIRFDAALVREEIAERRGDANAWSAALDDASDAARDLEHGDRFEALLRRARFLRTRLDADATDDALRELEHVAATPRERVLAMLERANACVHLTGDQSTGATLARKAIASGELADEDLIAAYGLEALALERFGRFDEAAASIAEAHARIGDDAALRSTMDYFVREMRSAYARRDADALDALVDRLRKYALRAGDRVAEAIGRQWSGMALAIRGRAIEGADEVLRAADAFGAMHRLLDETTALQIASVLLTLANQIDRSTEVLSRVLERFEVMNNRRGIAVANVTMSYLKQLQADFETGLACAMRATALGETMGDVEVAAAGVSNAGEILCELGREREALAHYERSIAMRRELGQRCELFADLAHLAFARASLGEHVGAAEAARELLDARDDEIELLTSPQLVVWMRALAQPREELARADRMRALATLEKKLQDLPEPFATNYAAFSFNRAIAREADAAIAR